MALNVKSVSMSLDKKLIILGFEVLDLLALCLVISILNFVFGSTSLKLYLVWIPSIVLATVIRIGKRGKPDNYILHWIRFQIRPGIISAFPDSEWISFKEKK